MLFPCYHSEGCINNIDMKSPIGVCQNSIWSPKDKINLDIQIQNKNAIQYHVKE